MQNTQNKIWNATLYLRLSRDDGDKEESNSITGQRELLRDYISQRPEFREYAVRVDDGFSGSTFERPSFQKMIEDVKAGRTDCIIVKDLSRFGRNYLDAGEYIEKIFPFLGVRFIAVNDNYDSLGDKKASDDLIIPFKNLINEAYCRDISVKIRSQLEIKRKNGQFLGSFAAFGYLKDEQNKNKLVVDQYAADIVRDIFKWKLEGVSPQDIADALNKLGVLSPMEYKRSLGMKFTTSFKTNSKALWSAGTVIRVLKNPIYTGVLIQGKETTPSYKVHKRVTKDESEWTVIEDSHEAIISKIDFDSVQKVLKCDTRRSPGGKAVGLFSGMIFCGDCGASMVRKTVPAGEKKYVYYVCSAHKQDKSCSPHRIRDNALEEIVLDSLKQHISEVVDMSELLTITDTAPLRTAQAQKVQRQLDKKHEEYEKLQKLLMSLYENLTDGIIDREEYTRLKASFTARADEAEKQMDALRGQLEDIHNHGTENAWMNEFIKRQGLTALDRAVVVALIDKILIHSNDVVEIIYRWQDEFAWQLDILRSARLQEVV
ncbi:MAG: Recombinase [Firmicutes bacterium ADurb.Bin182]|jgi:site-specific DNA recombinase|nr:MAG: Recombinase [Firmicutes bacterium ADurb.Bin182]HOO05751.1 recombinase family protein [Ruminococcus sp.]HRU78034.1 recombinase family protein [Rectinema sp.]